MSLKDDLGKKLYDVRLRDKHLAEGKFSQGDLEKHLKDLPDDQANYTTTDKESRRPDPSSSNTGGSSLQ